MKKKENKTENVRTQNVEGKGYQFSQLFSICAGIFVSVRKGSAQCINNP